MHLTFQCNQTRQPQRNFSRPRRSTCTDAETISTQQCCCCCCAALKNKTKKPPNCISSNKTHLLSPIKARGVWITETNKYSPLVQARKWNNPLCLKMFRNTAAKKLNNCRKCYISVSWGSVSGKIQVCNMKFFHGSYNVMHILLLLVFFPFYYIYSSFAHAMLD